MQLKQLRPSAAPLEPGRTGRCMADHSAMLLPAVGASVAVWGVAIALRSALQANVAPAVAVDPLWPLNPALGPYWVGLVLCLAGLFASCRIGLWWRGLAVVAVAILARGLPVLLTGLPYGRDAYQHWGSVMLVQASSHVPLDAAPHTYLSLPFLFSWGALVSSLTSLRTLDQALMLLVGWQLLVPAIAALMGLMLCARLTPDPALQTAGALAISAASPFVFPSHFSPLSVAGPILWALFWLATLPASVGRAFVHVAVIFALILLHPLMPALYLILVASTRWIPLSDCRQHQLARAAPLTLTLTALVAWQVYVAAGYSLPIGLNMLEALIRNLLTLSALESGLRSFGGPTPRLVSVIRWILFAGFVLLAVAATLLGRRQGQRQSVFIGCLLASLGIAAMMGGSDRYGEFAARALPLVVPFAALSVLSARPPSALRVSAMALVWVAVPLAVVAVHYDGPARASLPADLAGLRRTAAIVQPADVVIADPDLRGFRGESSGLFFYSDMRRYRPSRVAESTVLVDQAATRRRMGYTGLLSSYELAMAVVTGQWSRLYDDGRVFIYRRPQGEDGG